MWPVLRIASLKWRSGSPAARALGLPVGDIAPMETLHGPCAAAVTPLPLQKWTTSNTKRAHTRREERPDAGRTLDTVHTSCRRVEPSLPSGRQWARMLSQQCSEPPHHMTIPTSDAAQLVGCVQGPRRCSPTPSRHECTVCSRSRLQQ